MIRVCIEVHQGAVPIKLAVRAESITRAVSLIEERHPARNVRVVFPIDPEEFFVSKQTGTGRARRATSSPRSRNEGSTKKPRSLRPGGGMVGWA